MLLSDRRSGVDKKVRPPVVGLPQPFSHRSRMSNLRFHSLLQRHNFVFPWSSLSIRSSVLPPPFLILSTLLYRLSAWQQILSGPLPLFAIAYLFSSRSISSPLFFGSVGDLSAEICQFQDANDDPTPISRGRKWESVGAILRWPPSAEFSFVVWVAGRGTQTHER